MTRLFKIVAEILKAVFFVFYGPESHAARRYEIQAEVERRASEARR